LVVTDASVLPSARELVDTHLDTVDDTRTGSTTATSIRLWGRRCAASA